MRDVPSERLKLLWREEASITYDGWITYNLIILIVLTLMTGELHNVRTTSCLDASSTRD